MVTLNYEEVEWITQLYATEPCNVNPYELPVFTGDVELEPQRDTWTRSVQLPDRIIRQTGIVRERRNSNRVIRTRGNTRARGLPLGGRRLTDNSFQEIQVETTSNTREVQNNLVASGSDDFIRS